MYEKKYGLDLKKPHNFKHTKVLESLEIVYER